VVEVKRAGGGLATVARVSLTFARRERHDLCDLALELGPDEPTLCGEWTTRELLAHLFVREHRPLSGLTDAAMSRAAGRPYPDLVDAVRSPGLTPFALKPVEVVANTLEYLVHHEDVRRAQPGWEPRDLDPADLDAAWRAIRMAGKGLVRPAGVPVSIRRSDTDDRATLRGGEPSVTVTGPVVELVLFLYGRSAVRDLTFDGPSALVDRLRAASLGA
jgi:uncharacterized protein (TIGR03085 family)